MAIQGLIRSARANGSSPRPRTTPRDDLVVVAFFFQYSSLFGSGWPAFSSSEFVRSLHREAPQLGSFFEGVAEDIQIKGIMASLSTSLMLVAPVLLMLRRWRLPFGAVTILFAAVAAIITAMDEFRAWELVAGALAAGVASDLLIARLAPSPDRVDAFRTVGALIPMALIGFTFLAVVWRFRLGWPAELRTGTVVFGGLAGYVIAFLMQPTQSPRASTLH